MAKELGFEHKPWIIGNKQSLSGDKPLWTQDAMPRLFEKFVSLVKSSELKGVNLDIGCGVGNKTVQFAQAGLDTIGIDTSEDALTEARKLIEELDLSDKCQVVESDCLDLSADLPAAASLDDIYCYTHLKEEEQVHYQDQALRLLPKNSYMLFVLFSLKDNHFHGHQVSKRYDFQFDPDNLKMARVPHYHGMHNVHYDEGQIRSEFSRFRIVDLQEFVHPRESSDRFVWEMIAQII